MLFHISLVRAVRAALLAFVLALVAAPALAIDGPAPLPAAPGAGNAVIDAPTAAAYLPGEVASPIGPSLVLVILAGGGLIAGVAMSLVDRQMRARRHHHA